MNSMISPTEKDHMSGAVGQPYDWTDIFLPSSSI